MPYHPLPGQYLSEGLQRVSDVVTPTFGKYDTQDEYSKVLNDILSQKYSSDEDVSRAMQGVNTGRTLLNRQAGGANARYAQGAYNNPAGQLYNYLKQAGKAREDKFAEDKFGASQEAYKDQEGSNLAWLELYNKAQGMARDIDFKDYLQKKALAKEAKVPFYKSWKYDSEMGGPGSTKQDYSQFWRDYKP